MNYTVRNSFGRHIVCVLGTGPLLGKRFGLKGASMSVTEAKKLIDRNREQTKAWLVRYCEERAASGSVSDSFRDEAVSRLEPLANDEAKLYLRMSPEERYEAYRYARSLFDEDVEMMRQYAAFIEAVGGYADLSVAEGLSDFQDPRPAEDPECLECNEAAGSGPQKAYVIGWWILHRKCCANNAGNGIAFGKPKDCYSGNVYSGSCPRCNWCPG